MRPRMETGQELSVTWTGEVFTKHDPRSINLCELSASAGELNPSFLIACPSLFLRERALRRGLAHEDVRPTSFPIPA